MRKLARKQPKPQSNVVQFPPRMIETALSDLEGTIKINDEEQLFAFAIPGGWRCETASGEIRAYLVRVVQEVAA